MFVFIKLTFYAESQATTAWKMLTEGHGLFPPEEMLYVDWRRTGIYTYVQCGQNAIWLQSDHKKCILRPGVTF